MNTARRVLAFPSVASDEYDMPQTRREPGVAQQEDSLMMPDEHRDLGLAILVAETETGNGYEPVGVVGTISEAREVATEDFAHRCTALDGGRDPLCPYHYALWTRSSNGAYEIATTINPHDQSLEGITQRTSERPAKDAGVVRSCRSTLSDTTLVLTVEGFLNIEQACEFRLRYADASVSDVVSGIDVIMSNGNSRFVDEHDPGFEQLIDIIEEQGYTMSTKQQYQR